LETLEPSKCEDASPFSDIPQSPGNLFIMGDLHTGVFFQ